MTQNEFLDYIEFLGSFKPKTITERQLRILMTVLMRDYAKQVEDKEELCVLALAAAEMAFNVEMQHQLDIAVGPEDGVH
jgi:hypothetical protein